MSFINPYWYQSLIPDPDCDPWFDQVSLLLHCDGVHTGTTFTDSSQYAHTVTPYGTAQTSNLQAKWGGTSLYTNEASRISIADHASLEFGDSDFTVEFWLRAGGFPSLGVLFSKRNASSVYGPLLIRSGLGGYLDVLMSTSGSSYELNLNCGTPFVVDTWHHVAVTRRGTTVRVFVGGTKVGEGTLSGSLVNNAHTVNFLQDPDGTYGMSAFMDDIRITKGFARYISNFTPPTAAFEDVGCDCDPWYDNVVLHMHCNGADGAVATTDSSQFARSILFVGHAQLDTAIKKFGTAAMLLDGTDDRVYCSDADSLEVKAHDFTLEGWWYTTKNSGLQFLWVKHNNWTGDAYSPFQLYLNGLTLELYCSYAASAWDVSDTTCGNFTLNTWHHVVLQRRNTAIDVYIDGVKTGGVTVPSGQTLCNTNGPLTIGGANGNFYFQGSFDEQRFTIGHARYGDSFTPPTAPFPDVPCTPDTDTYFLGNRALTFGGHDLTVNRNEIDRFSILIGGNASDFGDLTQNTRDPSAVSNKTRAVVLGGTQTPILNVIQYVTVGSPGNALDFGDLTSARRQMGSVMSTTRGIVSAGTNDLAAQSVADYITIATTGNAASYGASSWARQGVAGASSYAGRGVIGGGTSDGTARNILDYYTISTTNAAVDFGDLTVARWMVGATSNGTVGVWAGGRNHAGSVYYNEIDYITLATTGNATDFGDLAATGAGINGTGNGTYGVFANRHNGTTQVLIDRINISSTGNASDFGDLSVTRFDAALASGA